MRQVTTARTVEEGDLVTKLLDRSLLSLLEAVFLSLECGDLRSCRSVCKRSCSRHWSRYTRES